MAHFGVTIIENPATWNEVQKAINEAVSEHYQMSQSQACGPSVATVIYHKLVEKGMLKEEFCAPKKGS